MPLQMRPRGGGLSYAPYRDIAHCFSGIAKVAVNQLDKTDWNYLICDYLTAAGMTEEDLGKAAVALAKYINLCCNPDIKSPLEALQQAGFLDLPVPAQLALAAKLGEAFVGFFFNCTREAHALEEQQLGLDDLMVSAEAVCAQMSKLSHCALSNDSPAEKG